MYAGEKCNEAAKKLSDEIRIKLKELNYDRYKFVVQVIVGERREQGVRMGNTNLYLLKFCSNILLNTYRNTLFLGFRNRQSCIRNIYE